MYSTANGANTTRVMISWRILSCDRESAVYPIRFAGTWSRYSNSAIPQLTSAARYQGRCPRFRRWAYQAKVMKMLDSRRSPAVRRKIEVGMGPPGGAGAADSPPLPDVAARQPAFFKLTTG